MSFDYPLRLKAALLLLVLLAVQTSTQLARRWIAFDLDFVGQDAVTLQMRRFAPVRGRLPPQGVVGYHADVSEETRRDAHSEPEDMRQHFLAQYALAPVLLSRSGAHRVRLHNRPGPPSPPPTGAEAAPRVENVDGGVKVDFGNGLTLYEYDVR